MRESEQYGTARDPETSLALSEAWSWLMTHGLVVRDPSQSSTDAYKVSRLGREALQYGVARLAAGERLGVALHPRLAQRVQQQFLLGEFELAVFASMKEVEVRIRQLAGASQSLIGTKLMQQAFSPEKGLLTDRNTDPGEQVATMELFKGAIGLFKNPTSHRPVDYDDPTLASEVILLFSACSTGSKSGFRHRSKRRVFGELRIRSLDIARRRRFDVFELAPDRRILERYFESRENHVETLFSGYLREPNRGRPDRRYRRSG